MMGDRFTLRGTLAVFFAALMLLSGVAMPVASGGAVAISEAQDDNSTDSGDGSATIVGEDASSDESSQHPNQYNDQGAIGEIDTYKTNAIPPVDGQYNSVAEGTIEDFDELLSESGHATFSPNFNDNLAVGVATHGVSSNHEYTVGIDYNTPTETDLKVTPVTAGGEPIENSYVLTGEGDAVSNIPLSDEESKYIRNSGELLLVYSTCEGADDIQVSEQKIVSSSDEKTGENFEVTSLNQSQLSCGQVQDDEIEPPIADFTIIGEDGDEEFSPGEELTFDASASENPNGPDSELTYSWSGSVSDTGKTVSETFQSGTYTVTLTTTLGSEKDTVEKTFTIETSTPSLPEDDSSDDSSTSPSVGDPVAKISVTDEFGSNYYEGETLTFDAEDSYSPNGEIVDYEWDITHYADIGFTNMPTKSYSGDGVSHSATSDRSGTVRAILTVTDSEGETDTTRRELLVRESASPEAVIDASFDCGGFSGQCGTSGSTYTVIEGTEINFDGSDSSSPAGDIEEYEWNFAGGMVGSSSETPSRVYTDEGRYSVQLTVTDGEGNEDSEIKTVRVHSNEQSSYSPSLDSIDVESMSGGENLYEIEVSVSHPGDDEVTTQLHFQNMGVNKQTTHPEGSTEDGHTDSVTVAYEQPTGGEQYFNSETRISAVVSDSDDDRQTGTTTEEVTWFNSGETRYSNFDYSLSTTTAEVGETVTVRARCSQTNPCPITIAWGDGTSSTISTSEQEGDSFGTETHSYESAGEYSFEIREEIDGDGPYENDFQSITITDGEGGGIGGAPDDCVDTTNSGVCDDKEYTEYHWDRQTTETEIEVSDERPGPEWERGSVDHYEKEETDETTEIPASAEMDDIIPDHWEYLGTTTNTHQTTETEISSDRPSGSGWSIDEQNVDTTTETSYNYFWSQSRYADNLGNHITSTGDTRQTTQTTSEYETSVDEPSGSGWSIDEQNVDTTTETSYNYFWSQSRYADNLGNHITSTGDTRQTTQTTSEYETSADEPSGSGWSIDEQNVDTTTETSYNYFWSQSRSADRVSHITSTGSTRTVEDGYNYYWSSSSSGGEVVDTREVFDGYEYTTETYTTTETEEECNRYTCYEKTVEVEKTRTVQESTYTTEYRIKEQEYTTEYQYRSEGEEEVDQHRWVRDTTETVTEYEYRTESEEEVDQHRWEREVDEEVEYDVYGIVNNIPYYEWEKEVSTVELVTTPNPPTNKEHVMGGYTAHTHICGEDPGELEDEMCG